MKIAVIAPAMSVGGYGYISMLLKYLRQHYPDDAVSLFGTFTPQSIDSERELRRVGVGIVNVFYPRYYRNKERFSNRWLNNISNRLRKNSYDKKMRKIESIIKDGGYEVVFYAWPFWIEPLALDVKTFFIPHDFIHTHFFGFHCGNEYNSRNFEICGNLLKMFLAKGTPIVSVPFVRDELRRVFPEYKGDVKTVFLANLTDCKNLSADEIKVRTSAIGIKTDYILCPGNVQFHKNSGQLIGAYYFIKQKYPNIKLVMTGIVADKVYAKVMSPHYADHTGGDDWDIMSTGILSSEDFNAVLRGAKVVVNASRCEAGSGSGLDAWKVGVSVAMSNLPSFMQQMEFLKTKASLFDPMDAKDIARAVLEILDNPILAQKDAAESKAAMLKYTWDDVARQYMEIFKKGS